MSKYQDLKDQLASARNLVQSCKATYFAQKKLLTAQETTLIDAKIAADRAQEALESYEVEYVIEHSLDDERDVECARLATQLPRLLELIKNEPPLALLTLSDLDNARPKG